MIISKNSALIFLSQFYDKIRAARNQRSTQATPTEFLQDIKSHCTGSPDKRALLSLSPRAWEIALAEYPNIRFFNINGLTYELTKALNQQGYAVDIADYRATELPSEKAYDFYLGHASYTQGIIDRLPPKTFIMHYPSGAYWKEFNRMSQERYDNFASRKGLPVPKQFIRSLTGTEDGEEYLARRADAAFCSGPRTTATFNGVSRNMSVLYLGSYVEKDLLVEDRDFAAGRRNFLYVAGTSGNVQKGMDLLLEAFARLPHLHLYIYCKVEPEVSRAYRRELAMPNIHYIYHCSIGRLRRKMRALLRRINFTISAPIDTGPGTAMVGSLGLGLIPVGYIDIEAEETNSVLINSYSIEAIVDAAQRASEKSPEWCRQASRETLDRFERVHNPPSVGANFKAYLQRLGL